MSYYRMGGSRRDKWRWVAMAAIIAAVLALRFLLS